MSSFLKNMALVLFSLLLTLVLLEGAARMFKLGTGGFWAPDELLGWRNIAGASGWESCYGECQVHVTINDLGLRDRDGITYEKPDGVQRILFLGDSITAGMQVPLEDTFVKRLESHLGESNPGEWETINGAVNGFGTDNELIYYRLEGTQFEPDIVVLDIYLANDIYNNSRVLEIRTGGEEHKPYFTLSDDGELELQNYPVENTDTFFIRVGTFLKKHFQLPRFIAQTMSLRGEVPGWLQPAVRLFSGNRGVAAETNEAASNEQVEVQQAEGEEAGDEQTVVSRIGEATICDEEYSPEIEKAWTITKALIQQMREEVEASGSQFAVMSVPTTGQTVTPRANATWYCERPNNELNSFLEEEGIPYLDLLEAFRDYSDEGGAGLYFERDFHMNVEGHHLAGELLNEFVQESLFDG
ncbi:MAG: hypothetical protein GY943_39350 [Chloroflexi bacterium]|nr:hypothetical protein [Chloroflexota bacterium]